MSQESNIKALLQKAWDQRRQSNYEEARKLVEQAEALCQASDHAYLGRIAHIYMQFEADHDNFEKAVEFSKQSIAHYEQAQLQDKIAHATRHLADLQSQLGQLEASEANFRKVLSVYQGQSNTHPGNLANAVRAFAVLLEKTPKKQEALQHWKQAKELYANVGIKEGVEEAETSIRRLEG